MYLYPDDVSQTIGITSYCVIKSTTILTRLSKYLKMSSDSSECELHLSQSSSSFDEEEFIDRKDDEDMIHPRQDGNLPYQFEPIAEEPAAGQAPGAEAAVAPVVEAIDCLKYTMVRTLTLG